MRLHIHWYSIIMLAMSRGYRRLRKKFMMVMSWFGVWGVLDGKRINFSIWTMRTRWVSSGYHFDLEMRTGWHPYPVVIWKRINNWISRSFDCHPVLINFHKGNCDINFFIRVQEEHIRMQEELVSRAISEGPSFSNFRKPNS